MTLVSLISYIDRNTLAILAPALLADLHLTGEQYGWALSGFSLAYMAGNLAWGRWIDRFGLGLAMTAAVVFWSLASTAHAFTVGFLSLLAARTLLGFGEGATFPGGLRAVVQSLPAELRARGVAVAYSGGSAGAVLTPLIVTPIFVWYGWRGAFYLTGLIGLVWLAAWQWVRRDPRLRHTKEIASARSNRPAWSDPRVWSFIFAYAFGALPLGFVLYYAALYLRVLGLSQVEIGTLLWIPPLGWEAGYFAWGWWTDRTVARAGFTTSSYRRLFTLLTLASLPVAGATFIAWVPGLMALLWFAMFVAAGFIVVSVSFATTAFGVKDSGFLAGLGAGSWSALVAIVMPAAGKLFDMQLYSWAFLLAAAFPLAGLCAWLILNRAPKRGLLV